MQLFPVVVGSGFLNLDADLGYPAFGSLGQAAALDDGGFVFQGHEAAGGTEVVNIHRVQGEAGILADDGGAGRYGNVLEERLAAVAEAGGFDGNAADGAAQFVDHHRSQGFALDILGNDGQGAAAELGYLFQSGNNIVGGSDLAVGNQDKGFVEGNLHTLGVSDEVGREIATVEAHPFGKVHFVGHTFGFLDGDDAFPSHFVHSVGDKFGDAFLVGGKGGDAGDLFPVLDGYSHSLEFVDYGGDSLVDAGFEANPVGPGGDVHKALTDHRAGQDYGSGGAVADDIVGFGRGLFDQLRAHIFIDVGEFDLFGDGDAVAAHDGERPHPVEEDVAAAGAEGEADDAAEFVDAAHQAGAGRFVKDELLVRHSCLITSECCATPLGESGGDFSSIDIATDRADCQPGGGTGSLLPAGIITPSRPSTSAANSPIVRPNTGCKTFPAISARGSRAKAR